MSGGMVVAGGGLAGAACAAQLARAGADVTVIEREAGPADKICGEFLSVEAQEYLSALGVDVPALGGHAISRVRLVRAGEAVETALPFAGIGVSRRALDEAVLARAASCGARVRRGEAISHVDVSDGIVLQLAGGERLRAGTLFLATGKHDVRGLRRETAPPEALVGLKMYFAPGARAAAALAGQVALVLFRGGYAGLQMVEGGRANLCLLVDRRRLRALGGAWAALLDDLRRETPFLDEMLRGAAPLLAQPLTTYRVPYGFIHRARESDPALVYRLGDQAAVIPSFTGDGMAIALHSAALAASSVLLGVDAAQYHRALARDVAGQIGRAGLVYDWMTRPAARKMLFPLIRLMPASLKWAARMTRVPRQARLTAG